MVYFDHTLLLAKVKEKGMREHRPVIALDFPSFEAVKEFLSLFRQKKVFI